MQNSVPLIVDSFAGGGGASTGIEMALGRSPDIAINHNADALALHAANHPETLHLSENIFKVDPLDYVAGQHVGLAWFSPDCKHFSKAKGGKPVERNIRDLAWVIVLWAERAKPDVIIMENVEEWKEWGPLIETDKGLMPCPDSRGQTFQKWCRAMKRAGYKLQHRELRACDYGAPTIRKRLFVIARRDGKPIVWPVPTHGAPTDPDVIAGRKLPWRTAAEIIDWSLPCPSIFDTSDEVMAKHGLRAIRPLADATMARVARGAKRYVLDAARPFIVNLTHGVRSEDLDRPFNTITGANRGEKAVISPSITRFNSGATGSSMDEPAPTVTANSYIKKPGGAAPLGVIAPSLSAFYGPGAGGQDRSASAEEPVRVVTTENRHAVVAPHLMTMRNSGKPFNGADEPTHTITAGGAGLSVVAPVLTYAKQGGANRSADEPHHTITASKKDQNSVILPSLMSLKGSDRRDSSVDEPHPTVLAGGGHSAVVSAFVAQHNNDSRRIGGVNPGRAADVPISTVTSTGAQQGIVSAFVSRQFGASVGHGADEPSATVTAGVNKSALVAPHLHAYYGSDQDTPENEPFHTLTTKPRFSHVEAAISAPPFTEDQHERAREVAAFLRSHGFWDEREFVTLTIGDAEFVIVDIGMRMLAPRELYSAQGFPTDYKIDADADGRPFPKNVQVSCVGNSVSPPVAAAIVAANCQHLVEYREAAE
ncbi:DNA cytosine methyltransferase [Rhizobium lentis]|uniref:DNA cytosine methyltransferase n=1 Tax=Rhizobium lentis TaxID=1138194 RepID=UPI001A92E9EA|nr:DNA cytosine methyltransferase [Rhizobium lentis]MBX5063293.1 DNA cytosine methyltransferase [Rhizobium lentis]MBX5075398.1 DNA cytosine methyltransferase [Rhizobium lentis]QSW93054.1 DNA cytosine methyltransferase [Rhizobium lentis]